MKRRTPQDRAALLWKAANGKQSMTLKAAAEALGVTSGSAMAIIKRMQIAMADIPLMADYTPNMKKTRAAQRQRKAEEMQAPPPGEQLRKPFGQPVRPEKEDDGSGIEAEDETIQAEIWPPQPGLGKTEAFYRLR